jgi:hypothetical protein
MTQWLCKWPRHTVESTEDVIVVVEKTQEIESRIALSSIVGGSLATDLAPARVSIEISSAGTIANLFTARRIDNPMTWVPADDVGRALADERTVALQRPAFQ